MEYMPWGIDVVLCMFPESSSRKNVTRYFPLVERALHDEGLLDVKVKLVTYATVRAESAGFRPIPEDVSRLNTLRPPDISNISDTNLKAIGDVMTALVRQEKLDNKFGLYDYRYKTAKGKPDLGNNAHGEGEKYKGRGFVQLTGKNNYLEFSRLLELPELFSHPDTALDPDVAAQVLAAFVKQARHRIAKALATNDLKAVRRAVNGGTNGYDMFIEAYNIGHRLISPTDRPRGVPV